MKTIEQVKTEIEFGNVYTFNEFMHLVESGLINSFDGIGYFHDGEKETDWSVWTDYPKETLKKIAQCPYVTWYNK